MSPSCAGMLVLWLLPLWSTIVCRGLQRLTSVSTGLWNICVYMYIYIYVCVCVYIYIIFFEVFLDKCANCLCRSLLLVSLFFSPRLLQLHQAVVKGSGNLPNELLYGRVGYLYALVFVNQQLGQDRIPLQYIQQVGQQQEIAADFFLLVRRDSVLLNSGLSDTGGCLFYV